MLTFSQMLRTDGQKLSNFDSMGVNVSTGRRMETLGGAVSYNGTRGARRSSPLRVGGKLAWRWYKAAARAALDTIFGQDMF